MIIWLRYIKWSWFRFDHLKISTEITFFPQVLLSYTLENTWMKRIWKTRVRNDSEKWNILPILILKNKLSNRCGEWIRDRILIEYNYCLDLELIDVMSKDDMTSANGKNNLTIKWAAEFVTWNLWMKSRSYRIKYFYLGCNNSIHSFIIINIKSVGAGTVDSLDIFEDGSIHKYLPSLRSDNKARKCFN